MTVAPACPAVVSIPRAKFQDEGDTPPVLTPLAVDVADVVGRWFVCHVKSRMEKAFARDLLGRGVPYFLPMDELIRRDHRGRYVFHRPLFPGYVFAAGGKDANDRDGAASAGADLFATGRLCKAIDVVDQRRLVRDLGNLDVALRINPRADPCPGIVKGRPCRITSGAFQGVEGKVLRRTDGTMMIVLEVHMMSQQVVMEIPQSDVEPC